MEAQETENQEIFESREKLYDADADQRFQINVTHKGQNRKVAHILKGMSDEQFYEYEKHRRQRSLISGKEVLRTRNQSNGLEAAEKLWNELAVRREGYVERDDWKERTNLFDKQTVIENGLLACYPVKESADADIFDTDLETVEKSTDDSVFDDDLIDDDASTRVDLDCVFNGDVLTVSHHFRQPSAKDVKDYDKLMGKADVLTPGGQRARSNIAQLTVPSRAKEMAALYDRLIVENAGYAGRVPAHHKREAVMELLSRDSEIATKK